MCAKNRINISSSFLDIQQNAEWSMDSCFGSPSNNWIPIKH